MTLEESEIYVNLLKLREMVYSAKFHMTKADRVIFGQPLLEASGEALGCFILAFMLKKDKLAYMDKCIAWFTRLRVDLDFCVRENVIKFKKKKPGKDSTGQPVPFENEEDEVSPQKVELFDIIKKIDGDICRWRASLAKGRFPCE